MRERVLEEGCGFEVLKSLWVIAGVTDIYTKLWLEEREAEEKRQGTISAK